MNITFASHPIKMSDASAERAERPKPKQRKWTGRGRTQSEGDSVLYSSIRYTGPEVNPGEYYPSIDDTVLFGLAVCMLSNNALNEGESPTTKYCWDYICALDYSSDRALKLLKYRELLDELTDVETNQFDGIMENATRFIIRRLALLEQQLEFR